MQKIKGFCNAVFALFEQNSVLTLKAPITTAAEDKFYDIFPSFRQK